MKQGRDDLIFDLIVNSFFVLLLFAMMYPLYFILIASVSNPDLTNAGKVWLFPKEFNLDGYRVLFGDPRTLIGYRNTILYTVTGTLVNLLFTLPVAYALSRKTFKARKIINSFFLFTMFFSGGLVPTYLLIKNLGMLDTIWAIIIPNAVSVWNLIITRTYFAESIPDELADAAFIDGCTHIKFFMSIVLPLSKVIIVVIALFYGVVHWNGFSQALIHLNDPEKIPLQLFLRDILIQQQNVAVDPGVADTLRYTANLVQYSMIVVAAGPVLLLYPFVQKYFIKGVMIGSVKA